MGRRRRLVLLCALLGLLRPGATDEAQRVQHTYENVKRLQISMRPTAAVQVSSNEEENPKFQDNSKSSEEREGREEEKTLHDLVGVLQDMVQDIPTEKVEKPQEIIQLPTVPLPTEAPVVMATVLEPTESGKVHTVEVLEPTESGKVHTVEVLEPTQSGKVHTVEVLEPTQAGKVHTVEVLEPSKSESVPAVTVVEPSQSEMVRPALISLKPVHKEEETATSEAAVLTKEIATASPTPILEIKGGTSELVIHHTKQTTTEKQLVSVSLVIEKATTSKKNQSLDQLTNGALSNLEESLENVKKLNGILDTFTKKGATQEGEAGKAETQESEAGEAETPESEAGKVETLESEAGKVETPESEAGKAETPESEAGKAETPESEAGKAETQESEAGKKKPKAEDILALIERLIKTLKNTPAFVKEDRNLYKYIKTAETYIKEALELTEKAEDKLHQEEPALPSSPPDVRETEAPLVLISEPLPATTTVVHPTTPPPEPLAKKAEDAQVEMGKLKAFINLLYGFSPHLTTYAKNMAHKKVAEDIVEKALAVLHAIKNVFCGSDDAESKRTLKHLLQEDMELVHQAIKAKRAS